MKTPYFIKICGITNLEDAKNAVDTGATAIGFNFYKGSARYIEPLLASEVSQALKGRIAVVGVFVNEKQERVRKIAVDVKLTYCQFHGNESPVYVNSFQNAIKTFRINDSLKNVYFEDYRCSSYLLDSHNDKTFGGSGKSFNWLLAKEANEFGKIILAGGLNPENVEESIVTAQPWGVDVCSGVELTPRKKDHKKVEQFVKLAKQTFKSSE